MYNRTIRQVALVDPWRMVVLSVDAKATIAINGNERNHLEQAEPM